MPRCPWFSVALLATACRPAPATFTDADRGEIRRLADSQQVLFNAGRYGDAVALVFAEDAVSLPPNAPAAVGRAAIQEYMKGFPPVRDFAMVHQMIDGAGDLAVVHGSYTMTLPGPDSGRTITDVGKYLEVWKRQADGGWRVIRDSWTSDLPPQ
ncbi:MAG: DUF4440 domain-containing protein [Gemmatimonadales bacterium]|nr:DUF4440 domain-containing protein [Gemmatimonadales bacterium]